MNTSSNAFLSDPDRACRDTPTEVFITAGDGDDEQPYPSPEARVLCNKCPVRAECLQFAFNHDIEYGVWGGMSAYQRGLISRKRQRKTCPNCGAHDIIVENQHEICLACGVSWAMF